MAKRVEPLRPRHPSVRGRRPTRIHTMDKVKLRDEENELFQREALDIFTHCSNAGLSFHDCLMAIMLTGFDWGVNVRSETAQR